MINILKLDFVPKTCAWVHQSGQAQTLLAVSDANSPAIHIFDGRAGSTPLFSLKTLHRAPVHLLAFNDRFNTVVSCDEGGFVEYWNVEEERETEVERSENGGVEGRWRFKSETDLYEFKKVCSRRVCAGAAQADRRHTLIV